jgi:hypothetical protein
VDLFLITELEKGKVNHQYVGPLSNEDYEVFLQANRIVSEHAWYVAMTNMVVDNLDELADQIKVETQKLAARNWADEAGVEFMVNLNRRLMNYLVSWRFCIDEIFKTVGATFGKNSQQYRSLEAMSRDIYDSSFAYRLIYNLRNYISHAAFPIRGVSVSYEAGAIVPHLFMEATKLLEGTDKWQARVKKDLAEMDTLDVYVLAHEACLQLSKLSIEGSKELLRLVVHACATICSVFGKHLLGPGRLVVGEILKEGNTVKSMQVRDIPIKRLEELGFLNMLRNGTTFIRPISVWHEGPIEPE